jgi:hypothetical protein
MRTSITATRRCSTRRRALRWIGRARHARHGPARRLCRAVTAPRRCRSALRAQRFCRPRSACRTLSRERARDTVSDYVVAFAERAATRPIGPDTGPYSATKAMHEKELTDGDALALIQIAEPDAAAAELPDAVALDVVRRSRSGESPGTIAAAYKRPSEEAPPFDFVYVIVELSHLVVALRRIYEVASWAGGSLGADELYDQVIAKLKGQIENHHLATIRRLVQAAKEKWQKDDEKDR